MECEFMCFYARMWSTGVLHKPLAGVTPCITERFITQEAKMCAAFLWLSSGWFVFDRDQKRAKKDESWYGHGVKTLLPFFCTMSQQWSTKTLRCVAVLVRFMHATALFVGCLFKWDRTVYVGYGTFRRCSVLKYNSTQMLSQPQISDRHKHIFTSRNPNNQRETWGLS